MTHFDYQKFQADIDIILRSETPKKAGLNIGIVVAGNVNLCVGSGADIVVIDKAGLRKTPKSKPQAITELLKDTNIPATKVKSVLKNTQIKKYLCPVLKSVSGDVFEISKIITPILVALALAGTLTISLNPLIFAGIAIVITRMGVAGFCADCPDPNKKV